MQKINSKPKEFVIGIDIYKILRSSELPFDRLYDFHIVGDTIVRYEDPIFAVRPRNSVQNWPCIPHLPHHPGCPHSSGLWILSASIIIIDGAPDAQLTYKSMVKDEAAFELETYTSSHDVLDNLFAKGWNLIIVDIRTPQRNELHLYSTIKSLTKWTRVLITTACDVIIEIVSTLLGTKHEHILQPLANSNLLNAVKLCTI